MQVWHTKAQPNRRKEQSLPELERIGPGSCYLQLLQATEPKKIVKHLSHVKPKKKVKEIITRHPTSLYNNCCSAGSCSNRSCESNSLVLLCPWWQKGSVEELINELELVLKLKIVAILEINHFKLVVTNWDAMFLTFSGPWPCLDKRSASTSYFRTLKHSNLSSKNKPYVRTQAEQSQAANYLVYENQEIRRK